MLPSLNTLLANGPTDKHDSPISLPPNQATVVHAITVANAVSSTTTLITLPSPRDFTSGTLNLVQLRQSGWLSGANEGFLVTNCM